MKRAVFCLAICVFLSSFLPLMGTGAQADVIYCGDGSYLVVTMEESVTRATGTKSGNKAINCYDSDNKLQWTVTLTGTFTYDGQTSKCTSSGVTVNIVNDAWYTVSRSSGRSGSSAWADVVMGKKVLGITVSEQDASLTLSCAPNGSLS